MKVLAGDLGGTKTLLTIAECNGNSVRIEFERRYASADFAGLTPMLKTFVGEAGGMADGLSRACIAVAGPVQNHGNEQHAKITNLPWTLDSRALAAELEIARLRLINDFGGVGYGIEALSGSDVETLQAGEELAHGPRVVIGAGTGLGEGLLIWQGDHYEVIASEGGHTDFAPADDEQIALLRALRAEFGHVSWERLVAGVGLERIYNFLCAHDDRGGSPSPDLAASDDFAAAISAAALDGSDEMAVRALDLFVRLYGAQAGNLALTCLATGGVYVAGGIAPKIIAKLRDGTFVKAFRSKGRMERLLAQMPVRVVCNSRVGVLGAALAASRL